MAKKFKPPTIEEVHEFARSIGFYSLNPAKWWHHYNSNGWMVGKVKMSRWRSAVQTWFIGSEEWTQKKRKENEAKRQAERLEQEKKKKQADKNYKPVSTEQKKQIRNMRPLPHEVERVKLTDAEREQRRQDGLRDLAKTKR